MADVATAPVVYNVHTDHLNRPIAMSDSARTIVWRANYLPFGEVSSITGPASLDMRFPGQFSPVSGYGCAKKSFPSTHMMDDEEVFTMSVEPPASLNC